MSKLVAPLVGRSLCVGVALALAGCAAGGAPESSEVNELNPGSVATTAPLLAGSSDAADTGCNVILRSAQRAPGATGGYAIDPTTRAYVFTGVIDLSAAAAKEASAVGVAYLSNGAWWDVKATATTGAPKGFQRYAFRIDDHTVLDGMSLTSLTRYRLELAPYFKGSAGGRLFDHNRNAGAFDNYVLDQSDAWAIAEAPNVCPGARETPRAVLEFKGGYTTVQHAALVAGGKVSVEYALDRLPQCRATHNGYPAWGTTAFVRFLPGGQTASAKVNAFQTVDGTPTNVAYSIPFDADVPAGATSAEFWFENESGAGNTCQTWDSNYGANYRFEVLAAAPAAPAWAGGWGGSFNRACAHADGLAEPMKVDSYVRERACMFVDADVYVPALTDAAAQRPEKLAAQVEYAVDGGAKKTAWLTFQGRVGNDYRFRWELPRGEMTTAYWNQYAYTFRFSTDGATWFAIGQGSGPTGGAPRTVVRDASWCNAGWPGCP